MFFRWPDTPSRARAAAAAAADTAADALMFSAILAPYMLWRLRIWSCPLPIFLSILRIKLVFFSLC